MVESNSNLKGELDKTVGHLLILKYIQIVISVNMTFNYERQLFFGSSFTMAPYGIDEKGA